MNCMAQHLPLAAGEAAVHTPLRKVVLLAINAKYSHTSLAAWCLAAGVSRFSQCKPDVTVLETTIHMSYDDIAGRILAHEPDIVGIGAYIWNAGMLPGLLHLARTRLPKTIFILGGPEASYNAAFWLAQGADFVLCGEGEHSFPALIDRLSGKDTEGDISGLCWTQNGRTHLNPQDKPLDDWVDPYNDACLDAAKGRIVYAETARGCPFQCAFCLSGGSGVRFLAPDQARQRLYALSQSGAKTIKLVDRTFNCDAKRAFALFEYIIGLDTQCRFHFEVAADLFDTRTLSLLATAPPGRIQLEAGLQSFHAPTLAAASRRTDLLKAERHLRTLVRGQNIHIHVDLIAGLPYETLSLFQDGFDRAYALGAHTLQLGFLKLLHGSKLRGQAGALGLVYDTQPPYEIIGTPWLSRRDIRLLKQAENALQHTYNKGRFLSVLGYVLSVSGLRPFALYLALGRTAPNHATPLSEYAEQIYRFCAALPGVDTQRLREYMTLDWLSMVKGKNMPSFLKIPGKRRVQIARTAARLLGHDVRREEAAVLPSGKGVFVDSAKRDPVTGLYPLHFADEG